LVDAGQHGASHLWIVEGRQQVIETQYRQPTERIDSLGLHTRGFAQHRDEIEKRLFEPVYLAPL
jgi:hypothetical protein